MEILRIENLSFRYPKTKNNAIENISLSINRGEFVVVCGKSGCGKTTLLKLIKREIAPFGEINGKIIYNGCPQEQLNNKSSSSEIGYVLQNPDNQIVTDKVWNELAFGLENMGLPSDVIRMRVGEMANYFGIQNWFRSNTDTLSGGQKQLLNLASVMVMQPKILILDEPTSQLDPIAASDFITTLQKLNRELGLTVILADHRLEDVFPIADKVLLMDEGKALIYDTPRNIGVKLDKNHEMHCGLPSAVRIFNQLNISDECPLTVKEGRDFLENHFVARDTEVEEYIHDNDIAVELKSVSFRYEKNSPDILRDASLKIYSGEFFSIIGGNGAGKTTMLNLISGLKKPYRGRITVNGKDIKEYKGNSLYRNNIAYLPQNPTTLFSKDSIEEDFSETADLLGIPKKKIEPVMEKMGITELADRHPYDLSGGEQQKCAIAKLLLLEPKILLLDEPTKGLDAFAKNALAKILKELKLNGITVISVTHDIEFAAENSDRCGLFFDGEILSAAVPEKFFAENSFYTTSANRIARGLFPNAVTCNQVIKNCTIQIK